MIYLELFIAFLKVGLFSFGGAYGAIPLIRDVVLSHGWLSDDKLTYMIAVSESTPGPIMVNLATYVGNIHAGILGAIVATLGVILPSFCVILMITAILKNVMKNRYFQAILGGLKACVIGIILATGLYLIFSNCFSVSAVWRIDIQAVTILLILVVASYLYQKIRKEKMSPIMLIVISAMVGVVVCGIM